MSSMGSSTFSGNVVAALVQVFASAVHAVYPSGRGKGGRVEFQEHLQAHMDRHCGSHSELSTEEKDYLRLAWAAFQREVALRDREQS